MPPEATEEPGREDRASRALIPKASLEALSGRIVVLVAAALLAGAVYGKYKPFTWLDGDGRFYLNITKGLLGGTLDQRGIHPTSWFEERLGWNRNLGIAWSNISRGRTGTYYPKHSYVMPALMAPLVVAFGEAGTLLYNNLAILAVVILMFLLARQVANGPAAAAATLMLFGGSLFLPSAYHLLADFTHAGFALAALLLILRGGWGAAGLCLGMAIWARPINVVLLPPVVLLAVFRWPGWRLALRFSATLAIPLACYAAMNTWMFGAPWITAYQRVLIVKNGQQALGDHADLYTVPLLTGLERVFGSRGDGLVRGYPIVAVALLGVPILAWRHRRLAAVALAAMALNVLSTAKFEVFHSRYYVLFVALAVLPLAALAQLAFRPPGPRVVGERRSLRPWLVLGAVALAMAIGAFATRIGHRPGVARGPTLDERAEQMVVRRGDTPCDFWNGQHAAYECVGTESRDFGNLTGRVPSLDREIRGTDAAHALWVVPAARTRPLVARFPKTALGQNGFTLVFATTPDATGLPYEVAIELGPHRSTLQLARKGAVVRRTLPRPPGRSAADLVLSFTTTRGGRARGLFVNGYPR
ncbi:MAG: hypothetical protein HYY06_07885 [Deltaproteobacteria bacterium]|nr:hypothetical protein [Deltaproteobacteria bacterium]